MDDLANNVLFLHADAPKSPRQLDFLTHPAPHVNKNPDVQITERFFAGALRTRGVPPHTGNCAMFAEVRDGLSDGNFT